MSNDTDRPLRIALLNSADYAGGAETIARMLKNGLHNRGHKARLWAGRRNHKEDHLNTRVIPCSDSQRSDAQRFAAKGFFNLGLSASVSFCNSQSLAEVDLVHLHNLHGHYFSITAVPGLTMRAPLVWTFHDFFPITGGCAFPYDCDRWMSRCGECPQLGRYPLVTDHDHTRRLHSIKRRAFGDLPVTIVAPSEHLTNAVVRSGMFGAADVRTIPYGVDTRVMRPHRHEARQHLGLSPESPVVLLIAQRLSDPRKGGDYAVSALRQVDVPGLTVLLVGAGDTEPIMEALPNHDVRAFGYVADQAELARCYAAADLFIFTSLAENFPCVTLEAMACGTAVLAFNADGVNEEIIEGQTGFMVPAGDTAELARVASDLLRDRTRLAAVGAAARKRVEALWSLEVFLDRHEHLYREILARRQPREIVRPNPGPVRFDRA